MKPRLSGNMAGLSLELQAEGLCVLEKNEIKSGTGKTQEKIQNSSIISKVYPYWIVID